MLRHILGAGLVLATAAGDAGHRWRRTMNVAPGCSPDLPGVPLPRGDQHARVACH